MKLADIYKFTNSVVKCSRRQLWPFEEMLNEVWDLVVKTQF